MGTFSFEKAPIPPIVNHSWQKAPSYSYYNRSISLPIRRLTLHETRIRFWQTLSGLLPPDLFWPGWSDHWCPKTPAIGSGFSRWSSSRITPFSIHLISQLFKDKLSRALPWRDGATSTSSEEGSFCCLSFLVWSFRGSSSRLYSFPDPAQTVLSEERSAWAFYPGREAFYLSLGPTNIMWNMWVYKYLDLFISTYFKQVLLTIC